MTVPEIGNVMKIRKPSVLVACIMASTLLVSSQGHAQPRQQQPPDNAAAISEIQALWAQAQQLRGEGKLQAAIQTTHKLLAAVRALHAGPHNDLSLSLELLAELQVAAKDSAAAEKSRKELLAVRTQLFGENDSRSIDARVALEDLQLRQKLSPEQRQQLADADRLHEQALRVYGEGKARDALDLELKVLKVRRELLGDDHLDVAMTCSNIAKIYFNGRVFGSAEQYYRDALRIRGQQLGTTHPNYSETLDALAGALRGRADQAVEKEQFAEAAVGLAEALSIRASRHGTDDWRTRELRVQLTYAARLAALTPEQRLELKRATEVNQAGVNLYNEKKYAKAAEKFDEALGIRRKLLQADDSLTLTYVQNCAFAAQVLGQDAKAEKLFREAADVRYSNLGLGHKATRDSIDRLANHLEQVAEQQLERGEFDTAIAKRREVVQLRTILLGQDDYRVGDARRALKHAEILARLNDDQRKQLKTADQLKQTSASFNAEGQYAKAIGPCRQSLGICKKVLGEEHPDTASSLNNLALLYQLMGDYAQAEPLFKQSLEIRKKVLGDEHPDTATSLNNLALSYYSMGEYAKAEPLYRQSLEIYKKVLGDQHPYTATSLNHLASLYQLMGDYAQAEPLFKQSLEIRKKVLGDEHLDTATSLNNLALSYYSMGEYAKAEPLYRQSLEIRKKVLGEEHPDTASSLNNLALLYQLMGDYAQAEPLFKQSLEIRKKVLGDEHLDTATSLNNLALSYYSMGEYAKAEPLYRQSLEIRKKVLGEEHPDTASSLNNLALLYQLMGDYAQAEPLFKQSLEIRKKVLGDEHPGTATSLNGLAGLYQSMGDYTKAEPLYRESLEIRKKVLGDDHPHTAMSLNMLALLHQSMGDYAKAELLYRESLEIRKKVLGDDHPHTAKSLGMLAMLYQSMGDYAKAEPLYLRSLEIYKKVLGDQHPYTATSLNHLASLYASMGDYARAEPLFRQALQSTRTSLETASLIQSERQQLAMAEGLRYQLDNYLSSAMASNQHQEQAFRELLAWKGATLVRQRQMHKVAENAEVAPLFKKLQQAATRLATLSRMVPDPEQHVAWRRQITELTAAKERLESELSQKSSEFRQVKKQVTLEDVLTSLPKDAVLVDFLEYWRFNPKPKDDHEPRHLRSLLAFVVRNDQPILLLDLGPVAPLSQAIDTWRPTFGTSRDGVAAGRLLRERIWEPLEKNLEGSTLVLVSSDGVLGRLPIGALPGKEQGKYLLEEYRLAMLPVPQLLPALVSEVGRKELSGGLLLMGDVDYDADPEAESDQPRRKSWKRSSTAMVRGADQHFSHLDATAGEIATIKEVFHDLFKPEPDQIKTLKQTQATEQQFREAASKFYNLHLATHGFFASSDKQSALTGDESRREVLMQASERQDMIRGFNPGLLSGLAFSGANRKPEADKDDGILTADEIAALSLDGVDLVVLSACETGLGEVAGGEGLLGVQRAFQVAGARSTVASLWQVGDVATRRLMERFYRNYWEKEMSKLDALREAQLWLLNHPEEIRGVTRAESNTDERPKRLSPQFWAAFSLSGDWR